MPSPVLAAFAMHHGATSEVGERIARVLRGSGAEVEQAAGAFLTHHHDTIVRRPFALFVLFVLFALHAWAHRVGRRVLTKGAAV